MPDRWVILDAMGVVFEEGDDNDVLLVPYIQERNPHLTREQINELYYSAARGEIMSREFWTRLGFGEQYPAIERDYLDSRLKLDPECVPVVEELRKRYRFALISNDVSEWSAHLRERFDLDRLFESVVISGDVRLRKPDRRIYELLLDRISAAPGECAFVDDKLKNLCNASDMGFRTIHFFRKKLLTDTPPHEFSPSAEIRSFLELPEALERVFRQETPPACRYEGD